MGASDVLAWVVAALVSPWVSVVRAGEKMFWLHLLGSVVLALALHLRRRSPLRSIFPKAIWSHASARVDVRWYFVNGAVTTLLLMPVIAAQHGVSTWIAGHLAGALGTRAPAAPGLALAAAVAIAAALVSDFAIYFPHWLQHRVPLLWQFHKVHHSAEVLTPFTAYRFHPVDDLLNAACATAIIGSFDGALYWAFPSELVKLTILDVNVVLFLFYASGVHLRHSHVWLAYPRIVSQVLISPAMHQIHHSVDPAHHGKNLGLVFSVWDRVFGTLYVPETRLELAFGLGDGEEREFSSVRRLYALPFRKAWAAVRRRPRPALDGR